MQTWLLMLRKGVGYSGMTNGNVYACLGAALLEN
jgi:hypothetical protein